MKICQNSNECHLHYSHVITIIITSFETDQWLPISYFYKMVALGSTHTGEDIYNAIVAQLEEDGLMPWAERCVTSLSTDGACMFQLLR